MENFFIGENKIHKTAKIVAFNYIENSRIGKNCQIYGSKLKNCVVGDGVVITNSVLEDCIVKNKTSVGPFAYLRQNAVVGKECRVGDFVEIKNSTLQDCVKVAHLTYVGDAFVGKRCNIGCGTVFANYNGKIKQKIKIKEDCFIGANTNLVAPLSIGKNCFIGAGTTVRENIKDNTFVCGKVQNKCTKNTFKK